MMHARRAFAATLLFAPHAAASNDVSVALGSGLEVPHGSWFDNGGAISDTIAAVVPFRLDAGYTIARHFYVGLAGQLGVVVPGCPADAHCSGESARFGGLAAYHLIPANHLAPWLGVGGGFEILSVTRASEGAPVDVTGRGFEIVDAELGLDIELASAFRIGPVVSMSVGRFTTMVVNGVSTEDFDKTFHTWTSFGLRAVYAL